MRQEVAYEVAHIDVNVVREKDVRAGSERLQESGGRSHPRGENQGAGTAFEFAKRGFEARLRGILLSGVDEPVDGFGSGPVFESGGKVQRRGKRACRGISLRARVDGDGFEAQLQRMLGGISGCLPVGGDAACD